MLRVVDLDLLGPAVEAGPGGAIDIEAPKRAREESPDEVRGNLELVAP